MVHANAQGLRGRELDPKAPGAFRIWGLGDSFAFGWGVEEGETFYHVLERRLNREGAGRRYEVINAGIPGFGTYEELQLLRVIGLTHDPDLVMVAFYEGNDYRNNGEAPRRRVIVDGYLKDVPPRPPSALARWITGHSLLAAFVATQVAHVGDKSALRGQLETTTRLLGQMKALLDPRHIPLVVIMIPDQDPETYRRPAWLRAYDSMISGVDQHRARRKIRRFCRRAGVWYSELSRRFEDGQEASGFRLQDTHFNRRGHQAAGEEMAQYLEQAVLPYTTYGPGPTAHRDSLPENSTPRVAK